MSRQVSGSLSSRGVANDTQVMNDQDKVLSFWIEPKPVTEDELAARGKIWFMGGKEIDQQIHEEFGGLVEAATRGELDDWAATARGRLALVILLDQFPRNMYRGSPRAFASDAKAVELAASGYDTGLFDAFDSIDHLFMSLPFSHSENLEHQKRAVQHGVHYANTARPEWKKMMQQGVDFARKHLDVIARFGRFPHRNAVLGRESTPEETEYLEYLRDAGQWL
jgi:uncharacterized protein (DUF924 family)